MDNAVRRLQGGDVISVSALGASETVFGHPSWLQSSVRHIDFAIVFPAAYVGTHSTNGHPCGNNGASVNIGGPLASARWAIVPGLSRQAT